jgi:high affinity sulfate transporter 1
VDREGGANERTTARRSLRGYAPGVDVLRSYRRSWLPKDIVAGLILTALLVPQGMAYAQLAGLPPITGLYSSILCLLAYAVFGPSRVLVLGPDSAMGPLIAATLAPLLLADGDPARAVALASMLALLVGVTMLLAGLGRIGFLADLLSKPTRIGYLNGLALTILVGQLPKLFGFSVDANGVIDEAKAFIRGVGDGDTVPAALAVGVTALVVILVLQRWVPKLPAVLIAVVAGIAAVAVFDLTDRGVAVVGALPQGFPPFDIPSVSLSDIVKLTPGALGIALVALVDTISTSSAFAGRTGQRVRGNQEMVGIGAANIASGLFQGFPVSTSGSRTAVAAQAGGKTQLTGVVGAAAITTIILFLPGLFRDLPQPALAAVVIAAAFSLADVSGALELYRRRRTEFAISMAAFLAVALFGVLPGIGIAVALSILNVFRRAWWPYQAILGRVEGVAGFHDVASYPHAELLEGAVIFRFDAPLIFANARTFREQVQGIAEDQPGLKWFILAAEPITDVDTTAADMLHDLDEWLNARGISLVIAEMKDPVRRKIDRYELTRTIDPGHFFPTIRAATKACADEMNAEWRTPEVQPGVPDARHDPPRGKQDR